MGNKVANLCIAVGALVLAWVLVTTLWKEPLTYLKATRAQQELVREFDRIEDGRISVVPGAKLHYRAKVGHAAGRIEIPRLGLNVVFVQGTGDGPLTKGPGHYPTTGWPGEEELIAIAAHRTTYGAWFRHVDDLRKGDRIILTMPYGRFVYEVTGHEILDDEDWSFMDGEGERVVLSSCHPVYSDAQRFYVYAVPLAHG